MKVGDIYWCMIKRYGNKSRPCIILSIDPESDEIEVLPVTSSPTKNNITRIEYTLWSCCEPAANIVGYVNDTIEIADGPTCCNLTVFDCEITDELKLVLNYNGFNL